MKSLLRSFSGLPIKSKLSYGFGSLLLLLVAIGLQSKKKSGQYATMSQTANFITAKKVDHLAWEGGLNSLFLNNEAQVSVQLDPTKCGLGSWYYEYTSSPEFNDLSSELKQSILDIEAPHIALHGSAKHIQEVYQPIHPGFENILKDILIKHRTWSETFGAELIQNKTFSVSSDHTTCAFGTWLSTPETKSLMLEWPEFAEIANKIVPLHRDLHATVKTISSTRSLSEKRRIYTKETLPTLDILAGHFKEIIDMEEGLRTAQDSALTIFTVETEKALSSTLSALDGALNAYNHAASDAERDMNVTILIGMSLLLIIGVATAYFITISLTGPMSRLVAMVKDIAEGEGDLTVRLGIDTRDEIGELATWFDAFLAKLHKTITNISRSSQQVATASTEISSATEQLAAGAEEQQAQLSEVATSVEEMSAMILETSNNTESTQQGAQEDNSAAGLGQEKVSLTINGIEGIASIVGNAASQIGTLKQRSEEIGDVIQVIDDIADQTNLLALNANIEAARAGDAGRGFAVVADEVRKLAERTVTATADISSKINQIQSDVESSVDAMGTISEQSREGQTLASDSGSALQEISAAIEQVNSAIQQIASAAVEQSAGVEEISKNIEGVSTVSKQSATSAQELASNTDQLNSEVQVLENEIAQFKI